MVSMPLIEQPFQRIAMDVVGPLPRTQRGNRFILTICDYATRYPEAIALPSVEAPRVAKELVNLFSHVGIPDDVYHDGGNLPSAPYQENQDHPIPPPDRWTGGEVQWHIEGYVEEICEQKPKGLG